VTLRGDYLRQVVENAIGGIPTVLEVRCMCSVMSLHRILLEGSVSTDLVDPVEHQVDLRKVEVGIEHLGNIYLVADINAPGIYFVLHLGRRPSFRT